MVDAKTNLRRVLIRLGVWLAVAAVVTFPVIFHLSTQLIGDPQIDVWNHAWGYWFVPASLLDGHLPFSTSLVGAPEGGTLYFIDTPGALWALPITALLGPAVGYNVILIARVALAGAAGQLLAEELTGTGLHTWLAGIAYATTPFLLCELGNGISEVCATHWVALTLLAAARALRTGRGRDYLLLGLSQGMATVTTFYYGLTTGLMVAALVAVVLARRGLRSWRGGEGERLTRSLLWKLPLTAGAALGLMIPHWTAFYLSLKADDGLIKRGTTLNDQLIRHNAVDPGIYVTPGDFQSVDLLAEYGEPFVHTGYLRWAVIALVAVAVLHSRRLRWWAGLAVLSLVLGLGPYLWWDHDWVTFADGKTFSLPFDWLRRLLPQVAITHPLRLSIGGQALLCALAAGGLAALLKRLPQRGWAALVGVGLLVAGEGMFGSAARWPLPTSPAQTPPVLARFVDDDRAMLDLPAEVGTTMLTSRYFWLQTAHTRPIPYTPDVRLGSTRDMQTFKTFMRHDDPMGGMQEQPATPDEATVLHMRRTYAAVVVHPALEAQAELPLSYREALTPALGEPEEVDGLLVWSLPAITEHEQSSAEALQEAAERQKKGTSSPAALPGARRRELGCSEPQRFFTALVGTAEGAAADAMREQVVACGEPMADVCRKRIRNPTSSARQLTESAAILERLGSEDDAALIEYAREQLPSRQ